MADKAGNTLRQANTTTFRPITARPTRILDIVSSTDRDDYYRFRLGRRTTLEVDMDRMTDNANLQLLGPTGRVIARSTKTGSNDESIYRNLNAGTYYLRVFNARPNIRTRYVLSVKGRPDNALDNVRAAKDIGTVELGTANRFRDYVSPGDRGDFYKFSVDSIGQLDMSLRGLQDRVRLLLIDEDLNLVAATSRRNGRIGDSITRTIDPGTYYIRVSPFGPVSSIYALVKRFNPLPDGAGNSPADAADLGELPLRGELTPPVNEFIDVSDTDVYSFTANSFTDTTLNLNLTGPDGAALGVDLDLRVLNSSLQQVAVNDAPGPGNVTLSDIALTAGETYFVEVSKFDNSATAFFQLGLETEVDIDDLAPNTPDTGFDINGDASWNVVNGRRGPFTAGDFVGAGIDEDDYYQFSIDQSSFIDLIVTPDQNNAAATANIEFFKREGGGLTRIDTVVQAGNTPERIEGVFEPGDYVIRVFPETDSTFAFYDLSLEATSVSRIPAFIKDINPGEAGSSSSSQRMAGLGGSLYFEANDGTGSALWRTDGTVDGTERLRPFSSIGDMAAVNGFIYFVAADASLGNGSELWRTDGSTTEFVRDIFPGTSSSGISNFTVVGNSLYFTATDADSGFDQNNEVWVVDTTFTGDLENSVTRFDVNNDPAVGTSPSDLTAVGNKLYFLTADDEIYVSTAGAVPVLVDTSVVDRGVDGDFVELGGQLYFRGREDARGREIYRLNATTNAVELLPEIASGGNDVNASGFGNLTAAGGKLYFTASVANGQELYVYNPTTNTTGLVKDIRVLPSVSASSAPDNLTAVGNKLYFSANDATGSQLWVTEGTEASTQKVLLDSNPIPITSGSNFITVGPTLYFTASDGVSGNELWRIFPNESPELINISGDVVSNPSNLTEVNGRLFFRANTAAAGRELWVLGLPLDEVI